MLTDPDDDLAAQNDVATGLAGLAALGRVVRRLPAGDARTPPSKPDDLVHVLLALAGLGAVVEQLTTAPDSARPRTATRPGSMTTDGLLR